MEPKLRDLAAKGQLNHLSLVAHTDRYGVVTFRVSYRSTKSNSTATFAEDSDPVTAIMLALK